MSKKVYWLQSEDKDKVPFFLFTQDIGAFKNLQKDLKRVASRNKMTVKMPNGTSREDMNNDFFKEQDEMIENYAEYLL